MGHVSTSSFMYCTGTLRAVPMFAVLDFTSDYTRANGNFSVGAGLSAVYKQAKICAQNLEEWTARWFSKFNIILLQKSYILLD